MKQEISKKLLHTELINQINQTSLTAIQFFTANVPRQQETQLNQNDWESLINEAHETKSGKVQLPSRWAGIFTEVMKELNQYCNLNFNRHYIYGKGNKLMRADYYCNIEGCKLKGTCELYSNCILYFNLKNIPSEQFDAANLGNSGPRKHVFRQLRHEGKLKQRLDKDPIQSIRNLVSKFQDGYPDKVCETFQHGTISHWHLVSCRC